MQGVADGILGAIVAIAVFCFIIGGAIVFIFDLIFSDPPPVKPDVKCDKIIEKLIDGDVYRVKTGCTIKEKIK